MQRRGLVWIGVLALGLVCGRMAAVLAEDAPDAPAKPSSAPADQPAPPDAKEVPAPEGAPAASDAPATESPAEKVEPAAPAEAAPAALPTADVEPADPQTDEYYELFSVLVDTLDQIERNYVKPISRRELIEAAIHGALSKLDPYSNYIAPEEVARFRTSVESQFGGIGIQITVDDGKLKVLSPLVGSPAYRAGLQSGDTIAEIEGRPTGDMTLEEAVSKLKGEVGTTVTVSIVHVGQTEPQKVTLTREIVHLETVLGDSHSADDHWNYLLDPQEKIGYIRVSTFSRDTVDELRKALEQLQAEGMRGLVLDLRFNPGGLLTAAIEVSDLFISAGKIVSTEGRNSEARVWEAQAEGTFEGFPMAVLVNHFSASSSEIVAACLQDHGRAIIVGERTWGKGSVQNVIELEGGRSALKLTTASYLRPSGKNIHRFPDAKESDEWGVMPNPGYEVKLRQSELRELVASRRQRDVLPVHERKPAETQVATPEGGESKPAEEKPAEEKPTEAKPAEEKPTAQPPTESSSEEGKPAESTPDETKPTESNAAESPSAANKPAADEPTEAPAVDEPATDAPATDTPPAEAAPGDDEPTDGEGGTDDADESDEPAPRGEFVDRQLHKALDYIRGQLAPKS
ncbi:MAG: PDZ domain-containing protein [Pirellulales bacterium]|nr:PDZ domain-containing protein [Pirellulales bacterium]